MPGDIQTLIIWMYSQCTPPTLYSFSGISSARVRAWVAAEAMKRAMSKAAVDFSNASPLVTYASAASRENHEET